MRFFGGLQTKIGKSENGPEVPISSRGTGSGRTPWSEAFSPPPHTNIIYRVPSLLLRKALEITLTILLVYTGTRPTNFESAVP